MEQVRYALDPKKRKALYVEATQIIDFRLIVSELSLSR